MSYSRILSLSSEKQQITGKTSSAVPPAAAAAAGCFYASLLKEEELEATSATVTLMDLAELVPQDVTNHSSRTTLVKSVVSSAAPPQEPVTPPQDQQINSNSKKKISFPIGGFSRTLEEVYKKNPDLEPIVKAKGRLIARIRVFRNTKYSSWEYIYSSAATTNEWSLILFRGGTVKMYLNKIGDQECKVLQGEVEGCKHLKIYKGIRNFKEPRVHALASNNGGSYRYNNTQMKSFALSEVPNVKELARRLAGEHQIDDWNIGVDLLVYRSRDDSIGWHGDDTQDESIILCLVVHGGEQTRTLCIQPNSTPSEGYEQLELFASTGDMYQMDASMQRHYVHSVLKQTRQDSDLNSSLHGPSDDDSRRRIALIFRHGMFVDCDIEMGYPMESLVAPISRIGYIFGNINGLYLETLYSREELLELKLHQGDRRGVSGNIRVGADAIIVKNVNTEFGEVDSANQINYYASSRLGGGALFYSFLKKQPIRVFRSSSGNSNHCPKWGKKIPQSMYCFGGFFRVHKVWSDISASRKFAMSAESNPKDALLFRLVRDKDK